MKRATKLGAIAAAMALLFAACGDGAGGPGHIQPPITDVPIPQAPGALPGAPDGTLVDLRDHFAFVASGVFADGQTGNASMVRDGRDYFTWSGVPSGPNHADLPNAHNVVEGLLDAIALGAFDASGFTGIRFHHRSSHPWVLTLTDVDDGDFARIYPSWSPPPASNQWTEITIHFAHLVLGWGGDRPVNLSNIYQIGFQVNSVLDEEGGVEWIDGLPVLGFAPAWMEVANFRFITEAAPEPDVIFSMADLVYEEEITAGAALERIGPLGPHANEVPTWVDNPNGGLSLRVSTLAGAASGVRIYLADFIAGDTITVAVRGAPGFELPANEGMVLIAMNPDSVPPSWWTDVASVWGSGTDVTISGSLHAGHEGYPFAAIMANNGTGYFYVDSIVVTRSPD